MQVLGGCYAHNLARRCTLLLHAQQCPLSARSSLQVSPEQMGIQLLAMAEECPPQYCDHEP